MHRNPDRPLSPHLTVWKWGPHMLVSILHRVTGAGLAVVGGIAFVWWLLAIADGSDSYGEFVGMFTLSNGNLNVVGYVLGIGLTWAFFQHSLSGLRHLVMDIGAGFELRTNKFWAMMTIVGAAILTMALWGWLLLGRVA